MADTAVVGALARIEPQLATEAIANERFIRQLDELRGLKEFLFEEKVQFKEEDLNSIDLEELNNLSYSTSATARENVDLTDRNFLIIRVILGTLFAVLLGLPFSPLGLNVFIPLYWNHDIFPSQSNLVFSLIPFLAGFSTNLVLVILGKFVVAIEAVFGLSGRT